MNPTANPAPSLHPLRLDDRIAMIAGAGGAVGVVHGSRAEGVLMIDTGLAERREDVLAAVAAICSEPVRTVFTTHWHMDHVGANEHLGASGAKIIGHVNCKKRLGETIVFEALGRKVDPLDPIGRPAETFTDGGEIATPAGVMRYFHTPRAHTDGDAFVFFPERNVLHCGDLFFNRLYPIVDYSTGGTLEGFLAAQTRMIAQCDAHTKVIPGHGPLGNRQDLTEARDMLAAVIERMQKLVSAGRSAEEAVAAAPTRDFDAVWGKGMMTPAQFVKTAHACLARGQA